MSEILSETKLIILFSFLFVLFILNLVNFFILVYISAFLVRLRGFVDEVLQTLVGNEPELDAELPVNDLAPKTWDQKYEEELDMIQRQIRKERDQSGLVDLE